MLNNVECDCLKKCYESLQRASFSPVTWLEESGQPLENVD